MPLPQDGPEIEPLELGDDEELVVFRIVKSPDRNSLEFEDSFRSHAELRLPPRGPEHAHPRIYEGISVFDTAHAARETARRFSRLGRYVAELRIGSESGVSYLRWGAHGHLTLWGDSLKLARTVVDTIPVDEGD